MARPERFELPTLTAQVQLGNVNDISTRAARGKA